MNVDRWAYKVPEVAQRLGVSPSLMWRKVLSKEIPSFKVGRARRIAAETVERLLEASGVKDK